MARPISEPTTELAKRFRAVRESLGFKERKQFAEYLGIPAGKLGTYETGAKEPTVSAIEAYKTVCNVSLDWLITGEGEMFVEAKQSMARLPAENDIDREQLAIAIETVEEGLRRANKYPPPIKKAELIQIAYGIIRDDQDVNKIIRLVSAA